MTGNELVEKIASSLSLTKADVKKTVDALFAEIGDAAAKGEEIAISGFGKFVPKKRPARDGRNPATGEVMTIKAATNISFKPAKALKDKLNG
ncbi:HU family DNA-binding protein [Sandaracinobacter sp. RS1-74]|uniref:HU family DNA-binding protein n=1 Tax=Sandaracinobacteroides sayramensis TaxID=2913411 RepID=UPI001EDA1041|nr:HU family DNA-binding protein [Sandaracinobacteroides sayramensis]MCG2841215.1 HU family DNA-binding protein [Sandaracinobacteroides sayramensis]